MDESRSAHSLNMGNFISFGLVALIGLSLLLLSRRVSKFTLFFLNANQIKKFKRLRPRPTEKVSRYRDQNKYYYGICSRFFRYLLNASVRIHPFAAILVSCLRLVRTQALPWTMSVFFLLFILAMNFLLISTAAAFFNCALRSDAANDVTCESETGMKIWLAIVVGVASSLLTTAVTTSFMQVL